MKMKIVFTSVLITTCFAHAQKNVAQTEPPMQPPVAGGAQSETTPEIEGAIVQPQVFFVDLKDGAEVKSPVKVKMGVKGMKVRKALEDVNDIGSGHHHLIINGGPIKQGVVIPTDAKHLHFGLGQTEADVTLPRGKHKLTLQFADGAHKSYGEKMSATILVNVK